MSDFGLGQSPLSGTVILNRLNGLSAASFTDSVFRIKGSSDATKLVAFEVDGLTASTTRTLTVPDADITLAGINLAQTWTATQTFAAVNTDVLAAASATATIATFKWTGPSSGSVGANLSLRTDDGAAMASGDILATYVLGGARDSSGTINGSSRIRAFAAEDWSSTACGSSLVFQVTANGTASPATALTLDQDKTAIFAGNLSIGDTLNVVLGTSTGTKFGTSTSQKLAFYNATPIVQQGAEVDADTAIATLGLKATGGSTSRRRWKIVTGVNLNSANTDVATFSNMPAKWRPASLLCYDASTSLTTATIDLRTATAGGGTALLSASALTSATTATAIQALSPTATAYRTENVAVIRNVTAQGGAATATFVLEYVDLT